jgi:hypothetical protein
LPEAGEGYNEGGGGAKEMVTHLGAFCLHNIHKLTVSMLFIWILKKSAFDEICSANSLTEVGLT